MIPIGNTRDWNVIRADYINGASYGDLAKKYSLSKSTIYEHAKLDGWQTLRTNAANAARTKVIQKTANTAAENAVIAAELKKKLLIRLSRIEARYPYDATEVRSREGKNTVIFKIRDLTAAFRDLTDDMTNNDATQNEPIRELLRKLDGECNVL